MRVVFFKFFRDIGRIFSGRNLLWHALAIALTYVVVVSGVDRWVAAYAREEGLRDFIRLGNAGFIGFFMPFAVPIILWVLGWMRNNRQLLLSGLLVAQAELTGLLVSFLYKAFSGRPGPSGFGFMADSSIDLSTVFRFGFLRGGVFWGWPSSHITVAVAGMVALILLYRSNLLIKYFAVAYAAYMAFAVSITFHWLSDGVAAVIFGILVGYIVAGKQGQRT